MSHGAKKLIAAALCVASGLSLSTGCADNDSALFVRGVLAAQSPQCILRADPTSLMLAVGVLDLEFANSYVANLLVGNQLVRRGSRNQLRTETSRIRLDGAIVSVKSASGDTISEFTTIGTGFVDPGSGDEPGYGLMSATLVPPGTAGAGVAVNVNVRVFGRTLGGEDIESADLNFPVYVCQGCLIRYPVDADDPITAAYECALGTATDEPCQLGQDDDIDCRLCAGDHPMCRDPAQNPSGAP